MEGTLQYLKSLQPRLENAQNEDQEDFALLIQNVFTEIDGMEFRLSCHHDGSVLLEKLCKLANLFQARVFWDRLAGGYVKMACHRYASHVLEAMVLRACELDQSEDKSEDRSEEQGVLLSLRGLLARFEEELQESFDVVIKDTYASHVLRVYIGKFTISSKFSAPLFQDFSLYFRNQSASPVIQELLKKIPLLVEQVLDAVSDNKKAWTGLTKDKIGSRTCESVLLALGQVSSERFLQFYQAVFRGDLNTLLLDQSANFVIQALIQSCPNEKIFSIILDELDPLQVSKRLGVVFKIMEWPIAHGSSYERALTYFYSSFGLKTPSDKQAIVLDLKQSKMGVSILTLFTKYTVEQNKYIVSGLLELSQEDFVAMAMDRTAGHLVEALLTSANVSSKVRGKFCRKLLASAADLAVDRSGSFVIEAAFKSSSLELKEQIAAQLAQHRKKLEDSVSGRIVLKKCKIEDYERRQEEWMQEASGKEKKRNMLDSILDDEPTLVKKKHKKHI